MREWWTRVSCLLLALLLIVSALPVFAAESQTASDAVALEEVPDDFVILLDCSMSTSKNDTQNLCLQACWDFLDKLPIYDTRVSIITFGYESKSGSYYDSYSSFNVESARDKSLIHEIVPLSELTNTTDKEEYKLLVEKALNDNRTNSSTWTPYGHALAAAVDMLEKNTDSSASRNACIILITDGVLSDRQFYGPNTKYSVSEESKRLLDEASKEAGKHDWPIYSVQLNYGNSDVYESNLARERLATISANGGTNNVGSVECKNDSDVFIALDRIYKDFKNLPLKDPEPVPLPGSFYFDVENLTSEASIDIFGKGISKVSLYRLDENGNRIEISSKPYYTNISSNIEENDLMVTVGEGYYSIKMFCPTEGKWEAYIEGSDHVEVLVTCNPMKEMRLTLKKQFEKEESPITKNNTVYVDAIYTYHGFEALNNPIYLTAPAELKVYDLNNNVLTTIPQSDTDHCSSDRTGYHFQLPLDMDIFQDEKLIRVQIVVKDSMFRGGTKLSNIENIEFIDLHTTVWEDLGPITLKAHVGAAFELDYTTVFNNPDNDELTFDLTCATPGTTFAFDMKDSVMTIPAGMVPGEYPMSISVIGEKAMYDQLTLVVVNDAPRMIEDNIPDVKLWSDQYWFQKGENNSRVVDLNDYFRDFEGMTITYDVALSVQDVLTLIQDNSILNLEAIDGARGDVVVTVTAADGITDDSFTSTEFTVHVTSGKLEYWKENWIYYAIGVAIFLIIICIIIALLKNKKVKGDWQITVDDSGNMERIEMNIVSFTEVGKKHKFKLKELMEELSDSMDPNMGWGLIFANYFAVPGADQIELAGVFSRQGCTVTNIPLNNPNVVVNKNGADATKNKLSFTSGTLTFVLTKTDGSGDHLTITMSL